MNRLIALAAGLLLFTPNAASARTQLWTPGWDLFSEPLDYENSKIVWAVNQTTKILRVTFTLKGATPSKLYQVGVHIFNVCPATESTFGQFPRSVCNVITRQGVTKTVSAVEFGVVTTDASGNGTFTVSVGPLTPKVYRLEFNVRNGAGCDLTGGGSGAAVCSANFQSPGPTFGDEVRIRVNPD